ncbi:MAG TPA: transglycosylase family protein [Mycobacteriales bacterium]|nr:transglycosylase family protein [Mycobacteriales bacterium]
MGFSAAVASAIAPSAAHAATDVQWDRVAQCESGGNWHDNTGNGYYGGLQFSASTWSSFDVDHYAARADQASREEQIDVANSVLDRQGWNAWPVCSKYAGSAGTADHARSAHTRHAHRTHRAKHSSTGKATHHYVVRRGDTLSSIARAHDIKGGWHALYRRNRAEIGPNPAHLRIGMRLAY